MTVTIERRYMVADLDVSDGRTIVGRCVPYNEVATVADAPDGTPYQEVIRAGAFGRYLRALGAGRVSAVRLNVDHGATFADQVGHAVELVERDDGLHGSFRIAEGPIGENALSFVRSGALPGMSVTAAVHASRTVDGIVERTRLALEHVALTAFPAYPSASVLAVRSADDLDLADPPLLAAALARSADLRAKSFR